MKSTSFLALKMKFFENGLDFCFFAVYNLNNDKLWQILKEPNLLWKG